MEFKEDGRPKDEDEDDREPESAEGRKGASDLETRLGTGWRMAEVAASRAAASLALTGASSIEEIMAILPSLCLRLLRRRSRACFSSACVHAYSTRELRTLHSHTLGSAASAIN